jgi:hypothetical protein
VSGLVSEVRFTNSPDGAGRLGFVRCRVGSLRLDGLTLRRTRGGRLAVSFPCRRDGRGRRYPIIRPISDRARRDLERAILAELDAEVRR